MQKITSTIKGIWSFFVGVSNIISCIAAIASCYIAYTAASEIFHLNVEISPIVEKLQKDSVIIEKTTPIVIQKDISYSRPDAEEIPEHVKKSPEQSKKLPVAAPNMDSEDSQTLQPTKIDSIRSRRDAFLERMKPFFGKR